MAFHLIVQHNTYKMRKFPSTKKILSEILLPRFKKNIISVPKKRKFTLGANSMVVESYDILLKITKSISRGTNYQDQSMTRKLLILMEEFGWER